MRLAAAGLGILAVVLIVAMFFFASAQLVAGRLYTAAFLAALAAIVLAAVGRLRERSERLTAKPLTRLGWWSLGLTVAGLAVFIFVPVAIGALREAAQAPLVSLAIPAGLGILLMVGAGVAAVVAWFRQAERSVLVLITLLPAMFALYFATGELAFTH
ncbi:hypothetical protein GCM10027449_06040 [Sinomonas notoginsengisoli]